MENFSGVVVYAVATIMKLQRESENITRYQGEKKKKQRKWGKTPQRFQCTEKVLRMRGSGYTVDLIEGR